MTVVGEGLGGAVGEDDCELTAGEHPWVAALALSNRQRTSFVVPVETDGSIYALFVTVGVALVFIEGEGAVGTGVEAELEVVPGLLTRVLHLWS